MVSIVQHRVCANGHTACLLRHTTIYKPILLPQEDINDIITQDITQ